MDPISTYLIAFLAALVLGMSKAGLKGMGIVVVTLMALIYGARASTGIVVPLLLVGDVIAVIYYNRHTQWRYLTKFVPLAFAGIIVGSLIGKEMPEAVFQKFMAIIILLSAVMMILWERYDKSKVPDQWWFAGSMGFAAGFTTMIGNLAGAFSNIFFLATRIPKNQFIGTSAWLFLFVNIFKMPFHIFSWKTINVESLWIDLSLIPGVFLGFFIGLKVVSKFKNSQYRKFIIAVTVLGAIVMLLK